MTSLISQLYLVSFRNPLLNDLSPLLLVCSACQRHYVESVCIRSFSGPHFLALGLNTDIYSVSLRIQSKFGKMKTRKTPNTDTFYAV